MRQTCLLEAAEGNSGGCARWLAQSRYWYESREARVAIVDRRFRRTESATVIPCRLWVGYERLSSTRGSQAIFLVCLTSRIGSRRKGGAPRPRRLFKEGGHTVLVLRRRVVPRAHVCAYRCYLPPMFQKSLSQACLSPERTGTLAMGSGCIGSFSAVPLLSTAVTAMFFATTALP